LDKFGELSSFSLSLMPPSRSVGEQNMSWKELLRVLLGSGLAIVAPVKAMSAPPANAVRIDTRDKSLVDALLDVARQSGIELVLAVPAGQNMPAPRIRGRYGLDEALSKLLLGSGLTYRRTAGGAYVVTTRARAPVESEATAIPEILVVGKKTQNSDIRRREGDIQPYKIWTGDDVAHSHSSAIDDFLRSRVTSNAQNGSALQAAAGDGRSEVDLRGLGSGHTLIVVDGRRLPQSASLNIGFAQPDLNGIPLSAIDRIEVLNSTAGGIYGPGATAGVINIVLKRDYQGFDIGMTQGLSERGDAATRRIDTSAGFSSVSGRTQIMIAASRSWGADLSTGDRDFTAIARALQQQRDPAGLANDPPVSASVNIVSRNGDPLRLDPAYGGASLGAPTTSVPINYLGVASDGGALYRANAGTIDIALPREIAGSRRSLLTRPRLSSLLGNVRQSFSDSLDTYVDLLILENAGKAMLPSEVHTVFIEARSPTNPFQQDILVSYPLPGYGVDIRYRSRTSRLTGGLIARLPGGWKANADYSLGRAITAYSTAGLTTDDYGLTRAAASGVAGADMAPAVNPLAGQATFLESIAAFSQKDITRASRRTNFGDLTLRLAGPLTGLNGGALSLSVLAEDRREKVPASTVASSLVSYELALPAFRMRARSISAELRAPIIDRVTGPPGLRGLQFQLAARHDANRFTTPENPLSAVAGEAQRSKADATSYTAGLQFLPIEGIMLRASMASGYLPATIDQIPSNTQSYTSSLAALKQSPTAILALTGPADPLRGGTRVGSETVVSVISGGSRHLKAERARSISAGIVLTPIGLENLRLALDYSRIDKRNEISISRDGDQAYFLAHETQIPGRVIRAVLTDADRANGYVGGIVTAIDTTSLSVGKTLAEAVDLQLDYRIPTDAIGDFRVQMAATWQPRLARRDTPDSAMINLAGYADGPLKWRANGGVDWQRGPLNLGVVSTYYHGYRAAKSSDTAEAAAQTASLQGKTRVAAQIYFDLYVALRFALHDGPASLKALDIRFGIQNLFDHRPPIIVDPMSANYSLHGDPRLRRFELSIIGHY
jgi:iron complex outermembrane receptor protein